MTKIAKLLRDFHEDDAGNMSVELLLVVPMLVWALLSTLVYFDVFRAESISTRAGLTIADMISREQTPIGWEYLVGIRNVLRVLTSSDSDPDFRATVYEYRASTDKYMVFWSRHRGMGSKLTNTDLEGLRDRLPLMANGDKAILVETRIQYSAPFSIGMGPFTGTRLDDLEFQSFTVITPRFTSTICFDPSPADPSNGDEIC